MRLQRYEKKNDMSKYVSKYFESMPCKVLINGLKAVLHE